MIHNNTLVKVKPAFPAVQTVSASDVDITFGTAGAKVTAATNGNGAISYAVKSGDAVAVDASTGALTTLKVGTSVITVTAAETDAYLEASTDVTVTVTEAQQPSGGGGGGPSGGAGGGAPSGGSGTTFTGIVEGSGDNTASTTVSATIENGMATIAEVKPEEILKVSEAVKAGETTSLVIYLSEAPVSVTALEIPADTVQNIAGVSSVGL